MPSIKRMSPGWSGPADDRGVGREKRRVAPGRLRQIVQDFAAEIAFEPVEHEPKSCRRRGNRHSPTARSDPYLRAETGPREVVIFKPVELIVGATNHLNHGGRNPCRQQARDTPMTLASFRRDWITKPIFRHGAACAAASLRHRARSDRGRRRLVGRRSVHRQSRTGRSSSPSRPPGFPKRSSNSSSARSKSCAACSTTGGSIGNGTTCRPRSGIF